MKIPWLSFLFALAAAPLLPGIINRTKAICAGRKGQPILQLYHDLWKLLHKSAVYSRTTSWVFRAGPVTGLASLVTAALLMPMGNNPALNAFQGDLILFAGLFSLGRFVLVLAALDTGSSFEGMGASREVWISAMAEPAFFLALAALARWTGSLSLSGIFMSLTAAEWTQAGPALALITAVLFILLLAENARIPVDDPNTHLELTMIHEVMVLDHSGPDFAGILYGSSLKLWLYSIFIVNVLSPLNAQTLGYNLFFSCLGVLFLSVLVGIVESVMARLRMPAIPQLLVSANALAILALLLVLIKG
jgi:formate hydrogenlyase subunit 4